MYTWKVDEHGWVVKAKSRLVARSFKQREGVNFGETFAPTVSSSCVRLLSAIACECGLDLESFHDLGGGRGCHKFVPVLGGDGTKIAPPGDLFDRPPGEMR